MNMKMLHVAAYALLWVGGLNWLLYAFGYNAVNMLLGSWPTVEMAVYVLVGLSAVYTFVTHKKECKVCGQ